MGALIHARCSAYRVAAVVDRVPAVCSSDSEAVPDKSSRAAGDIELRDVVFAYPSRPSARVLDGLSMRVAAGEVAALVGGSGGGKSTILQLVWHLLTVQKKLDKLLMSMHCLWQVMRFYDPQSGTVLLDGRDLRSLDLSWLRSQIGLVAQVDIGKGRFFFFRSWLFMGPKFQYVFIQRSTVVFGWFSQCPLVSGASSFCHIYSGKYSSWLRKGLIWRRCNCVSICSCGWICD